MATKQPTIDLHASKAGPIIVIIILFPILAAITVALRVYTRFVILKKPALDDAFAIFALALSIGSSISQGLEVKNGMGRHIASLTPVELVACFKALYASIILYNLALTMVKLSILVLYLRLCVTKLPRTLCYALLAFVVAYSIETFFAGIFTCTPVAFFWNSKIKGGKCLNKTDAYYANAAINIFTDVALLLLPAMILKHLTLPRVQKLVVMLMLAFGGFACVASIFRLRALYTSTKTKDPTWDKTATVYWSTVELNVGIMCASMPTLRSLFSRFFPNVFGIRREMQPISKIVDTGLAKFADSDNSEKTGKGLGKDVESGNSGHGAQLYSCYENIPTPSTE